MAIPDFLSGAMENWGLITYREDLLYEEGVTTASTKDWIVEVVAHELAHMVSDRLVVMVVTVVVVGKNRKGCAGSRKTGRHRLREGLDRGGPFYTSWLT